MKYVAELKPETEEAIDKYIDELISAEKPVTKIQTEVKARFADTLKTELGESKFEAFEIPIERIRTIHATVCARKKQAFACAGLFED